MRRVESRRVLLRRGGLACLLACVALSPTAAEADDRLEPPPLERFLHWGGLRIRPGLELKNVGYDDNILYNTSGEEIGDYTATIVPRVDGLVLFGRNGFLTFDGRLERTVYRDNSDQNFTNQLYGVRFTLPVRRAGVYAELGYDDVKERPLDREDLRPERRNDRRILGVVVRPGWRTEIVLERNDTDIAYTDPDAVRPIEEILDRSESGTKIDVAYRVRGRSRALLTLGRNTIDFDFPGSYEGQSFDRDAVERRALGGLELGRGGPLVGSFRLGWSTIDADDPGFPDISEMIGDAELNWRLGARTRVRIDANREIGFSIVEGSPYYLNTEIGLRGLRFITRVVGVEAGVRAGRLAVPAPLTGDDRLDHTRNWDLGVRLRLGTRALQQGMEYTVRYGRFRRDSSVDSLDQARNTLTFGAVLDF